MKDCYYSKYEPIFGAWHITEELGSGAEGHLYRIRREDALGHVFYSALKAITIPADGEDDLASLMAGGMSREEAVKYYDSLLDDTVSEFSLLEKLKGNSNIVSYEDHEIFRREEGFGWDILIRLEELTPLIKHSVYNHMDEDEIVKMGTDLCRGLAVCRRFGIVHRDIKPENIFISPAGSYKLGDFGIARIVDESTKSLSRKGTYSYMAPEVYWGREYDSSVDLYSLGMVMYRYMNDGRMPFMPVYPEPVEYRDGETAFAKRMGGSELPLPRNGSDALKAVILKACAYDRADRYDNADEMLRDLENLSQEGRLTGDSDDGQSSGALRAGSSRRRRAMAAIAVLLVLAAFAVYSMIPKEVEDIETAGLEDGMEIYIDEDVTPEYTVMPEWFSDEPVTFRTSDEEVLAVDESGALHAGIPGEAVLTISAKEYSEEAHIKVVPKVTSIGGIGKTIEMTTGNTLELKPVLEPEKFADEPVTYSTGDKKIAEVSKEGKVTAVSAGETELTVSAGGSSIKAKVTVSDPVVYRVQTTKKSSSSKKKSSSGGSKGYFSSSDDEHF